MISWVVNLFNTVSGNPVLAGAVSIYGLTIITYVLRNIPLSIFSFIIKHLTTTLYVSSTHEVYHLLMRYMEANDIVNSLRVVKFINGRWGYSDTATKGVGYGSHIIRYNGAYVKLNLIKEDNKGDSVIDTISITKLGRSHKLFDDMFNDLKLMDGITNKTKIYVWRGKEWCYMGAQPTRTFKNVYLDRPIKEELLFKLDQFKDREVWYNSNGIPYRMGLFLHGKPGTGKTSVIKAIAAHLNINIYFLSVDDLDCIDVAASTIPDKCLMVIEDIDSGKVGDRNSTSKDPGSINFKTSSLSCILNAIDGVIASNGRVLVMTTNKPSSIDPALLRPGRVDINLEIGCVTYDMFKQFINNFFPGFNISGYGNKVSPNITIADLQLRVLNNAAADDLCRSYLYSNS